MDIGSDVMSKTMWEEIITNSLVPKSLDIIVSIKESQSLQSSYHTLLSVMMQLLPVNSRLELLNHLSISSQHYVVNLSLFLSKLSIGRPGGGNVRAVPILLHSSVHQEHISILDHSVIVVVVKHSPVLASGTNLSIRTVGGIVVPSGLELIELDKEIELRVL